MKSRNSDKPQHPAVETDERFPSGPWVGFWIQHGMGKQKMSLSLTFIDGRVSGEGRDVVGRFNFVGNYDLTSGRVHMRKHYENAHSVGYDGANQGDGMWLWGVWHVGGDRGGFHLWPEGEDDPTQGRLRTVKELPIEQAGRRVILEPVEAALHADSKLRGDSPIEATGARLHSLAQE